MSTKSGERMEANLPTGNVIMYNGVYGFFVPTQSGENIQFHVSQVEAAKVPPPVEGQGFSYQIGEHGGRPTAINLSRQSRLDKTSEQMRRLRQERNQGTGFSPRRGIYGKSQRQYRR